MSLRLVACVWFNVVGDGSSTAINIDLTTDPVSFSAGLSTEVTKFADGSNLFSTRELSTDFKITSKNPPIAAIATVIESGPSASSTVSGTILTVTFVSALSAGQVTRVFVELTF